MLNRTGLEGFDEKGRLNATFAEKESLGFVEAFTCRHSSSVKYQEWLGFHTPKKEKGKRGLVG